jgi:hypothetical protein
MKAPMAENNLGHALDLRPAQDGPVGRTAKGTTSLVDGIPRIRHSHQFEIKLRYPLPEEQHTSVYDFAVYFFLPPSLGVSRASYGKERFFEDMQSYIRLKTPEVAFTDLSRGGTGPLSRLSAAALRLQGDTSERSIRLYEHQSKLFCCVLKSALRECMGQIEAQRDPDTRVRLMNAYRMAASSLRATYSALRPRLCTPKMPPSVQTMYRFTDEYISSLIEEYTFRAISAIPDVAGGEKLRIELIELVKKETQHRITQQYPSVASSASDNENFVYRRGVLKKFMNSVLFLNVRSGVGNPILEEGLFGVAAGISMVFATAVLFVSTQLYGALTGPVFFALVISYIFKDRIKERMRRYLSRKAARWLFDHRTSLYVGDKDRIGVCSESVDFLDANMVPAPVTSVRNRTHITEIEGGWIGERAIRYRKLVKLFPVRIADIYDGANIHGLNDIMRFSVDEFVQHIGTIDKPIRTLVDGEVKSVQGDRVHHMNVIVRHAVDGVDSFQRYRIILNHNGIKRIETVAC